LQTTFSPSSSTTMSATGGGEAQWSSQETHSTTPKTGIFLTREPAPLATPPVVASSLHCNTVESQLLVHIHIPAPPIQQYAPADSNAVPAAPVIKITSFPRSLPEAGSTTELVADEDIVAGKKGREASTTQFAVDVKDMADSKEGSAVPQGHPLKSARFLDSDHLHPPIHPCNLRRPPHP